MPVNSPVIDACVARSSSRNISNSAQACITYACLDSIRKNDVTVIFSKQLSDEWSKHASRHAISWLASMHSKNRVKIVKIAPKEKALLQHIRTNVPKTDANILPSMEKDIHLFCAAMMTDRIIISLNDSEALKFKKYASIKKINNIHWINPVKKADIVKWIEKGLPYEDHHRIDAII